MKRFFVLFFVALFLIGAFLQAEERVLIDFSQLDADYPADNPENDEETLFYFGDQAGASVTDEQRENMFTSLAIEKWEVELASSSAHVENMRYSEVKQARVREGADNYAEDAVLGVRVHFPTAPYNSWALVTPPFEIPAYEDPKVLQDGELVTPQEEQGTGDRFNGIGVLKNVGVIKSIKANVLGLNFPHSFSILLKDETNEVEEIYMGNLEFDGWNTIEWQNPNYIESVRDRELRKTPLYPHSVPMVKLVGIRFYRDGYHVGGDFISYVKDISVVYDRALLDLEPSIDHDEVWGILSEREAARRAAESRRLGNRLVLQYLERERMHDEEAEGEEGEEEGEGTD